MDNAVRVADISSHPILCITDSLGLPRPGVFYHQTWPAMLKKVCPNLDFVFLCRRAATTEVLADRNEYLYYYTPSIVVLQLGICDCSPRYMRTTSRTYRLLGKLPMCIQTPFWKIYKIFVRRSLKRTDVAPERFEKNIRAYLSACLECGVKHVLILRIATPASRMLTSNPLAAEAVRIYNALYERIAVDFPFVCLLNPLHRGVDGDYVDGYHANEQGNRRVAEMLWQTLSDLNIVQ